MDKFFKQLEAITRQISHGTVETTQGGMKVPPAARNIMPLWDELSEREQRVAFKTVFFRLLAAMMIVDGLSLMEQEEEVK